MHVTEYGGGSPNAILLLHGQMLGAGIYDALAPRLAQATGLSVLVPDLPGYGRSPLPEDYSMRRVQQGLAHELRARGVESVAIVGYSLGSYLALALALGGTKVAALVLVGPLAGLDGQVREAFRQYATAVRAGGKIGETFAAMTLPDDLAAAHPGLRGRVEARVDAEVDRAALAAELDAIAAMDDLRPRLGEISSPVLVRVGDRDQNTPEPFAREIAAAIPGARLELVPGVGHLYWDEDAEATSASVERFVVEATRR